ncbi:hypothetical protein N7522_002791 [Penicillium canescens]|nr:hypothetical protein N7522_002791 [Penicillium canescens]
MLELCQQLGLSVENLQQLNPGITCPNLDASKSYYVMGNATDMPSSTTSTTTTTTKASTTTESAPSVLPTLPGIAANCDRFYKVSSGDQCDTIATKHNISEAQFKSWNSQVDASTPLSSLPLAIRMLKPLAGLLRLRAFPGATTTAPKPTAEPTGLTPQMPGMVSNCKAYHLIKDGDSCYTIDTAAKITLAQFRAWNTRVDATCSNLWLGYYVCVGV